MPAPQITKSDVSNTETLAVSTKNRDRDAFQKEMDAEIKALVDQWLAAEKVSEVPEEGKAKVKVGTRPKARYHVSPEDKAPFKDVLRRAGTINKVELVFLYPVGPDGKPLTREPVDEKTGKVAVTLTLGPRSAKRAH